MCVAPSTELPLAAVTVLYGPAVTGKGGGRSEGSTAAVTVICGPAFVSEARLILGSSGGKALRDDPGNAAQMRVSLLRLLGAPCLISTEPSGP